MMNLGLSKYEIQNAAQFEINLAPDLSQVSKDAIAKAIAAAVWKNNEALAAQLKQA